MSRICKGAFYQKASERMSSGVVSVVEKHLHKWDRVKDAFYQKTSEEMVSIVVSVVEKHLHKWDRVKGAFYKKASEKRYPEWCL